VVRTLRGRAPIIAVVLATSLQAIGKAGAIGDSDGWWHFRTGKLILETHRIPRRDPYSWTAAHANWHPNAWLSDVFYALLRRAGGLPAIAVFRAVFVIAFGLAIYWLAREYRSRPWPAAVMAIGSALVITPFIAERPQLFSFLLLPAAIVLARRALNGANVDFAGLLVLIAAWANIHGVFVTGIAVIAAIAGGRVLHRRRVARAVLVVAGCIIAGLATPFGWGSYSYALHVRSVSGPIQEWRHFHVGDPRDQAIAVVAVLAALAMVRTKRYRRWDCVAPVALLAVATLDAIRNGPLLVTVAAPEIALGLSSFRVPRLRAAMAQRKVPAAIGLLIAWVALTVSAVQNATQPGRVDRAVFPVQAVRTLPTGCRLLNEYDLGGYVIDRRWPPVLVSQDGRNDLYGLRGKNRVLAQSAVLHNRNHARAWLDRYHVNCVLAHRDRPLVRVLARDPRWRVAVDEHAGVLLIRVKPA